MGSAVAHRAAEVGKVAVLVPAVNGVVPTDEVEQLVARGELDLAQPLVRLDARRELDLVAVRIEAAAGIGRAAAQAGSDDDLYHWNVCPRICWPAARLKVAMASALAHANEVWVGRRVPHLVSFSGEAALSS